MESIEPIEKNGHLLLPTLLISNKERKCRVCKKNITREEQKSIYACKTSGCKLTRVHVQCLQSITTNCKKPASKIRFIPSKSVSGVHALRIKNEKREKEKEYDILLFQNSESSLSLNVPRQKVSTDSSPECTGSSDGQVDAGATTGMYSYYLIT